MGIQEVLLIVMCGTSIALLITGIWIVRLLGDISRYSSRIDTWACAILRKVDPTNQCVSWTSRGFSDISVSNQDRL